MVVSLSDLRFSTRIFFILVCVLCTFQLQSQVPDKASPFTAVKWEDGQAKVRWEGDWYTFHSINGISVEVITDFCKETYERRWQKRFSEDLVEVLTTMGYQLKKEVELVLTQNGTSYSKTGIMSEDYRDMVRDFNNGIETENKKEQVASSEDVEQYSDRSSQQKIARQMAEWMDMVWDEAPPENAANLRFLFFKDGKLFFEKIDIHGDFVFRAKSSKYHSQAFNPNKNGRWVYEDLEPGVYNLSITGQNEYSDWSWSMDNVRVEANTKPIFEINLD